MKRLSTYIIFGVVLLVAVWPFVSIFLLNSSFGMKPLFLASLNLVGWCAVLTLLLSRSELRRSMGRLAAQFGIERRFSSFETMANNLMKEVERKNSAFISELLERRIGSKEELSRTLERIVAHAFRLLSAESAELALFDKELGLYHSSFVLGKPFRKSAQAMLSGAIDSDEGDQESSPDVLVQLLAFGGSVLGSLRVGLKRGTLPTIGDRDIMHLLALQGSLAIINAQYTEELVRMRRSADESVKVKTGFLANLSHEIRGPLGIMLNAVELVLDGLCGPVSTDQLDTLKMVKSNGAHLLELINDVLDYAKVESGKIVANRVEIVLYELLKDICAVVRSQAEAKGHTLVLRDSEEVLTLSCDRRHLRQMLINMLTNAIKYTPEKGSIEVWAERIPGNKMKVSVKDSGVGIESSDRDKVFSPFERIQHAYSIKQVGTGFGMPLTRKLAEVNGGTIDFTSEPNRGSVFWLVFPAIEYSPTVAREEEKEKEVSKGKGELVLVVEADSGELNMIVRYLTHLGYRVLGASNRLEAMQVIREQPIELALIDNNIVDNSEELFIKEIRDNAKSARLPLMLLSSRAFVFDIEKYLKIGVDRCLSKPVSLTELGQTCRGLLDGEIEQSSAKRSASSKSEAAEKQLPVVSRVIRVDDLMH